jgi:hypothetical protein
MRFGNALVVWSIPANKNIGRFVLGWDGVVWELSRLWAPNGHEKNLLTRAISAAVKLLAEIEAPDAVVSYADPNVGHLGGIYRAASWVDHGQSEESRAYRAPDGPSPGPPDLPLRAEHEEQGRHRGRGFRTASPRRQT